MVNPITKFKIISNNPADQGEKPVEEQLIIRNPPLENPIFEINPGSM